MAIMAKNITSKEYNGDVVLEQNTNRGYFYIIAVTGALTVEFNNGGGLIPLAEGSWYEPQVCPTGPISIVGKGPYVVVEG